MVMLSRIALISLLGAVACSGDPKPATPADSSALLAGLLLWTVLPLYGAARRFRRADL